MSPLCRLLQIASLVQSRTHRYAQTHVQLHRRLLAVARHSRQLLAIRLDLDLQLRILHARLALDELAQQRRHRDGLRQNALRTGGALGTADGGLQFARNELIVGLV